MVSLNARNLSLIPDLEGVGIYQLQLHRSSSHRRRTLRLADHRQKYVVPQDPLMAPSTTCVVHPKCCCCDDADDYLLVVVSRRSRLVLCAPTHPPWRSSDRASGYLMFGSFRTSKSRRLSSRRGSKTKRLGRSDWPRLRLPVR